MTNRSEIIRGMAWEFRKNRKFRLGAESEKDADGRAMASALDYLEAKVLGEVRGALIAINDLIVDDYFEPEKVIRELVETLRVLRRGDITINQSLILDDAISAAETYLKGE